MKIGRPHIVINVGDAPCEAFFAVGIIGGTGLPAGYHLWIGNGEILPCVRMEQGVGCVAQALIGFRTVRTGTVSVVVVQLIVFFLVHDSDSVIGKKMGRTC